MFGRWSIGPEQYAEEVRRYSEEIGGLDFVSPQDWMCEPIVIRGGTVGSGGRKSSFAGTGLCVSEHQRRTVENYVRLTEIAPEIPWIPVIQGFSLEEYMDCITLYETCGVRLPDLPRAGVGSVCRRQSTREVIEIFSQIKRLGIKTHGFGLKSGFLAKTGGADISSCDSMAWSDSARRTGTRLPGCSHKNCANCMKWAIKWRKNLLKDIKDRDQMLLPLG